MAVGGAQRLLFAQARWFNRQGYDVITAFFYDKDHLRQEWQEKSSFPVFDLNAWQPGSNLIRNGVMLLSGMIRLWRILRKKRIDAIETFTPDSNILGLFVAWLAGVPVRIASHHGNIEGAGTLRKKLHGWLINRKFCHRLVVVSEQVKEIAIQEEGVKPEKIRVILNGIEPLALPDGIVLQRLREEIGIKSDDFVYLTIGRLTIQKGHTYLLDAIPNVLSSYPNSSIFLFVGDGHQRRILEEKINRLGLSGKAILFGTRKEIPEFLSLADVFVLPSLWEGLPLALLEAMSFGLPVVATRVEGVKSLIEDGKNGYLVSPKDTEALAKALIDIRSNPDIRSSFSKRNLELVNREYSNEKMCALYELLFQNPYIEGNVG